LGLLSKISITNKFVIESIKDYPSYLRAGVLGPDCFPDLVAGQIYVHVNKGAVTEEEEAKSPSDRTFEQRTFDQWRSVDNAMAMLRQAWLWPNGESTIQLSGNQGQKIKIETKHATKTRTQLLVQYSSLLSVSEKTRGDQLMRNKQQVGLVCSQRTSSTRTT
jgi:hypothetical protein